MSLLSLIRNAVRSKWKTATHHAKFNASDNILSGAVLNVTGKEILLSFGINNVTAMTLNQNYDVFFGDGDTENGIFLTFKRVSASRVEVGFRLMDGGVELARFYSSGTHVSGMSSRSHVFISVNLAGNTLSSKKFKVNGNDANNITWNSNVNQNISWSNVTLQVGGGRNTADDVSTFSPLEFFNVVVDDYFTSDVSAYWDPATNKHQTLGRKGQRATGEIPLVYLNGYGQFDNMGSGGSMSLAGSALTQGDAAII